MNKFLLCLSSFFFIVRLVDEYIIVSIYKRDDVNDFVGIFIFKGSKEDMSVRRIEWKLEYL